MNYKITFEDSIGLLVAKTSGKMNADGFIVMAKDLLRQPQCLPNGNVIFDHTALEFNDVALDDLRKIRAFHASNEERIGSGKSAIVVRTGLSKEWHRLWSKGEKIKTQNKVRVFENYNDAINWIKPGSRRIMGLKELREELKEHSSKEKAEILRRFFKTGPGEYAQGDVFMGVKVPQIRSVVRKFPDISLKEVVKLLKSEIHEERLSALFILVFKYTKGSELEKERIYKIYLKHTKYINNWDLIDLTAAHIIGAFLINRDKGPLYKLVRSKSLWERRMSILATFCYIKKNKFNHTLKIAKELISDKEDLIHKAVGWMLREIGKRDLSTEEEFLIRYYKQMPRTMLRYAIERFPESKRLAYLKGMI